MIIRLSRALYLGILRDYSGSCIIIIKGSLPGDGSMIITTHPASLVSPTSLDVWLMSANS